MTNNSPIEPLFYPAGRKHMGKPAENIRAFFVLFITLWLRQEPLDFDGVL
jgi:hypothetical protein